MRCTTAMVLAAAIAAVAAPSAASDLTYRHRDDGPSLLEGSNGRPYWLLLAECAGFYGAMANVAASEADATQSLDAGVDLFRLAVSRLRIDRQIDQNAAVHLMEPHIERARRLAEANMAADPAGGEPGRLTPRVVMRSTCNSLRLAYDDAVRS
ncbi:hypothetical protein [Brevundimonas sp.]|uniref:hypothetical protein n=1 Tax=Brevundimonas sp. TaxID=1871086 RepID=UPI0025FFAAC9|nr:hypothetical protein [Brevundimonas sp.]